MHGEETKDGECDIMVGGGVIYLIWKERERERDFIIFHLVISLYAMQCIAKLWYALTFKRL